MLNFLNIFLFPYLNLIYGFLAFVLLNSCAYIPYNEKKIVIPDLNESITSVDIYDIEFQDYLIKKDYKEQRLPIKEWGLNELLLAQNFFNYDLKNAKKEWLLIQSNEDLALLAPASSVGVEVGRGDSGDEISKNIFGGGFNFTLETANKKLIRYEIAFNETQSALLNYELKIWETRITLLKNITNYIENQDLIKITKDELKLKQSIIHMLKKRIELGVSSQVELERIKLELGSINQSLISLQFKQAQQIKKIALSLGMSQEKFNLIPINVTKIKELINAATIAFLDNQTIIELKSKTIISNKTLRIMLANYAIKESKLKYEIAKQYPDFNFSPAYFYDMGNNIWSIGIDSVLNASKKNKLLIEKAKKIRSLEAGKVKKYQLSLINDSELLLFNFHNHLKTLKNSQRILEDKNNLKKQLQNRFNQGILGRLELELEIIKLNQIDKDYHKALYNLLRSGLDAEKIMQRPIFTNKLPI